MCCTTCEHHTREALELARKLIAIADEGTADCECRINQRLLLDGIIRDCGYEIERAAAELLLRSSTKNRA